MWNEFNKEKLRLEKPIAHEESFLSFSMISGSIQNKLFTHFKFKKNEIIIIKYFFINQFIVQQFFHCPNKCKKKKPSKYGAIAACVKKQLRKLQSLQVPAPPAGTKKQKS